MKFKLLIYQTVFILFVIGTQCFAQLSDQNKKSIDAFVKDAYKFSWELQSSGKKIGALFIGLFNNEDKYPEIKKHFSETIATIDLAIKKFDLSTIPDHELFKSYKKTYIEYLKWQKNASKLMLEKVEEIFVKSKSLDIEQKKIKFKKAIQELFSTEKVLKSKLEKLKIIIYEELNKK